MTTVSEDYTGRTGEVDLRLSIPDSITEQAALPLPSITQDVLAELAVRGWKKVGVMVAIVDSEGSVLIAEHNVSEKCTQGVFGPLGETACASQFDIEQPAQTLRRGLREEYGIQDTDSLNLRIPRSFGWRINRWPHGRQNPDDFSAAVSFPVFVDDSTKRLILNSRSSNPEVTDARVFVPPHRILEYPDNILRPGVKPWLNQLLGATLLSAAQSTMPLPESSDVANGRDITIRDYLK